jgi:FtsP/CotA-like multicopper oxidase with cupredoxin domain
MEMTSATYASLDPTNLDNFKNPLHLPGDDGLMGVLDASDAPVRFTAQKESVEILPGKRANLLAYHAERHGKTYVNPTFKVRKGKEFSAEFANNLDEETTVHWHGLHVDWRMDGHPFQPVTPGATYRYSLPVQDRGSTYWYHPHPHGRTAIQTYSGLSGLYLVEDEDERKLTEALDLRFGLLERPQGVSEVFLSPAERVDVLLDLTNFEVGEEIVLRSLPFDPMHHEHEMKMGGGMDHMEHMGHMDHMEHMQTGRHHHMDHHVSPTQLSDGSAFYLLKLVATGKTDYSGSVPETLSRMPQLHSGGATTRPITVSMTTDDRGMQWLINGKTHEMDEFPFVVQRGAKEIWEIHNDEKSMPHPMHIHGFQFRVLERIGTPEQIAHLVVDDKGRLVTDLGFKDTVLVWPGETVKWFIDFSHGFEGEQLYMFHCHILEHETAMMVNLKVV